jgi:hypothetical protein
MSEHTHTKAEERGPYGCKGNVVGDARLHILQATASGRSELPAHRIHQRFLDRTLALSCLI